MSAGLTGVGTLWLSDIGGPGAVVGKNVAVALRTAGVGGVTSAGLNTLGEVTPGSFNVIEVGDSISITGEGIFEVLSVDGPGLELVVDGPMVFSNAAVSWVNLGKLKYWGNVASVATDTSATFNAVFPYATGNYFLALLDNSYKDIFYDQYEESCPDEELELIITYTGLFPPVGPVTVPDTTPGATTTYTFTSTGDSYSVILDELVP
jgi:hypothetical protein